MQQAVIIFIVLLLMLLMISVFGGAIRFDASPAGTPSMLPFPFEHYAEEPASSFADPEGSAAAAAGPPAVDDRSKQIRTEGDGVSSSSAADELSALSPSLSEPSGGDTAFAPPVEAFTQSGAYASF